MQCPYCEADLGNIDTDSLEENEIVPCPNCGGNMVYINNPLSSSFITEESFLADEEEEIQEFDDEFGE